LEQLPALLDTVVQINSDAAESGGRGIFAGYGVCENQRLIMDVEGQYDDAIFLSLHCNALENDSLCHGVQIFYTSAEKVYEAECAEIAGQDHLTASPAYRFYDDAARCELATVLYTTITNSQPELAYQGDSAVIDSNYAVLRETNLTSALIEMGFITNHQDRARLQSAAGQQQMADSIAEAVYRFYCQ
jgi:N-acetylmuramoyl-L-alanine amidase